MLSDLEKILKVEHSVADQFTKSEAEMIKAFTENGTIERLFYALTLDYVALEDRIWDRPVSNEDAAYLRTYYSAKRKALSDIRADMEAIADLVRSDNIDEDPIDPYYKDLETQDPYFKDMRKAVED